MSNDPQRGNSPLISRSGLESLLSANVCLALWRAEREMVKREEKRRETRKEKKYNVHV